MNPGDLIVYLLFGFLLLIIIAVAWFVFRKRKKWAMAVTAFLIIGYIGYYAYFPTLQENIHEAKYEQVTEYLATKYPEREFTVEPEHFEEGYYVGFFDVNDHETPEFGVTLGVKNNGEVFQTSSWDATGILAQQNLWKTLYYSYHDDYSLDSKKIEITKKDEWIDGELTVFALNIDDHPTIAVYEYSHGGYGTWALEESQTGDVVSVEIEGHVLIYIDERHPDETVEIGLQNGKTISVDAAQHKGKLFVAE
ncbi:MAG TPA: hypothetical protein VK945_07995 [Planococcus sp. (in: firmicutes)]|nr:hypothetical protein [Planococcus sp. (in: firmicutes)]